MNEQDWEKQAELFREILGHCAYVERQAREIRKAAVDWYTSGRKAPLYVEEHIDAARQALVEVRDMAQDTDYCCPPAA